MVLGVPIVSYISNMTSLRVGTLFFAGVNAAALIANHFCRTRSSGERKAVLWYTAECFERGENMALYYRRDVLNGSVFGVYSYLSEYMETVTRLSSGRISILLLVYGLANMIGNMIAGRMLRRPSDPICLNFSVSSWRSFTQSCFSLDISQCQWQFLY